MTSALASAETAVGARPGTGAELRTVRLAFLLALVPFAALTLRFDNLMDDAFISFRYARHLATGYGLRFNLGTGTPVEGYSNLLWVALMAGFERLGLDVTVWSRVTSAASGFALLHAFAHYLAVRMRLSRTAVVGASLFLGCLPAMAVWNTGGLETMSFALALFLVFTALAPGLADSGAPRTAVAALAATAVVLLRVDGLIPLVAVGAALLVSARDTAVRRKLARALAVVLGAALLALAVQTVWRLSYYGDYLPNTVRVKGSTSFASLRRGALYGASFLVAVPACLIAVAAVLASLPGTHAARPGNTLAASSVRAAILVALGTLAYVTLVGGDWMPFGRYLVPGLPFLALAFGGTLQRVDLRSPSGAVVLAALGALLSLPGALGVELFPLAVRERLHFRLGFPEYQSEFSVWHQLRDGVHEWVRARKVLGKYTHPGESVILGAIGTAGYYTELVIYDTYGLTDREVARLPPEPGPTSPGHDKRVEKSFFLPRKPTYFEAFVCASDAPLYFNLQPTFGAEPMRRLVELERHPLEPEDGYPPDHELRLWRFRAWDLIPDVLRPLLDAVAAVDPAEPAAALAELRARFDPNGPAGRAFEPELRALLLEVQLQEVRLPGLTMRGARLVRPTADSHQLSVDVKYLVDSGSPYVVPAGEINYTLALEGEPRFAGQPPGWSVLPPGSVHDNRPDGGSVLTLSFLPGGAFAPAP